jgi:uncharacterized protein
MGLQRRMAYDRETLIRGLARLSHSHRVAFAAACCERLVPNYQAFSAVEGWGQPDALQEGMAIVWRWLAGVAQSDERIQQVAHACEEVAPDMEAFSSLFAAPALDAAAAVSDTLSCCLTDEIPLVVNVVDAAINTIDAYLYQLGEPQPLVPTDDADGTRQTAAGFKNA